jgi:hypothetical protein
VLYGAIGVLDRYEKLQQDMSSWQRTTSTPDSRANDPP